VSSYPKTVLIVGNGGRENALANALLTSPQLERLYITPANWGLMDPYARGDGQRAYCLDIDAMDSAGIVAACKEYGIELVVIGPEAPLVAGLADTLRAAAIPVLGPGQEAARLEGSKSYSKAFMQRHGIPTAKGREFSGVLKDPTPLNAYVMEINAPCVIKCDGLAAGKGVIVCDGAAEALLAVTRIAGGEFGEAGDTVLIEERLSGPEISFTCLVAGGRAEVLPPSSDYKRLRDGDEGPNTGGMGNICPTPYASDEVVTEFARDILRPTIKGMVQEGLDYRGFLFVGTMLTDQGLKVIEYNVRFGDPEAAVVLPLCKADWPALFAAMAAGELPGGPHGGSAIQMLEGACVAVVLASEAYPQGKTPAREIEGLARLAGRSEIAPQGLLWPRADPVGSDGDGGPWGQGDLQLMFAGVSRAGGGGYPLPCRNFDETDGSGYLASGGRCLTISARASNLSLARRLAYEVLGNLRFEGMQYRSDIGKQ
jgi:phosphoribosylamine--glycine ligase